MFGSRELVSQISTVRRTGSIVLEPDVEMLHFEENKVSKEFGQTAFGYFGTMLKKKR